MIIIKMTAAANVEPLGTPKLSWRERERWGVGTGIFSLSEWKAGAIFLVSLSKAAVSERRAPSLRGHLLGAHRLPTTHPPPTVVHQATEEKPASLQHHYTPTHPRAPPHTQAHTHGHGQALRIHAANG